MVTLVLTSLDKPNTAVFFDRIESLSGRTTFMCDVYEFVGVVVLMDCYYSFDCGGCFSNDNRKEQFIFRDINLRGSHTLHCMHVSSYLFTHEVYIYICI